MSPASFYLFFFFLKKGLLETFKCGLRYISVIQNWPRIAVPNLWGFTTFFWMHTNKEFLATCLKGSKDSRQQLAVTTLHRPRDTCWVGEATAPRSLVAGAGDVAAISVQAFWSPPLCSSHTAHLCKESAFLLVDTTHGMYYVLRPSAHSALRPLAPKSL